MTTLSNRPENKITLSPDPTATQQIDAGMGNDQTPGLNDQATQFAKPTERSIGEKVFHNVTYTGIGYFANLLVSVALWDFFIAGKGKPVYNGVKTVSKEILNHVAPPQAAENVSNSIAKYIFSPLGGHVTMVPVVLSEQHARYITHAANKTLDKNYKYKDLKANWSTPEDELPPLVNEPTEQTIAQAAARRGIGWVAVTAVGTLSDKLKISGPLERNTLKGMNWALDATGSQSLQKLKAQPWFQRYIQLAALDSYFTVITASITEISKDWFGKKHKVRDQAAPEPAPEFAYPPMMAAASTEPIDNNKKFSESAPRATDHLRTLAAHENYTGRLATEPQGATPTVSV